jgi:hypothetical protein
MKGKKESRYRNYAKMTTIQIKGSRTCDAKCYNAAADTECSCICGGRNHGKGIEAVPQQRLFQGKEVQGMDGIVSAMVDGGTLPRVMVTVMEQLRKDERRRGKLIKKAKQMIARSVRARELAEYHIYQADMLRDEAGAMLDEARGTNEDVLIADNEQGEE